MSARDPPDVVFRQAEGDPQVVEDVLRGVEGARHADGVRRRLALLETVALGQRRCAPGVVLCSSAEQGSPKNRTGMFEVVHKWARFRNCKSENFIFAKLPRLDFTFQSENLSQLSTFRFR